jgi:hypothetical protein
MNYKDLRDRCVLEFRPKQNQEDDESAVFYFKPETFLLDEPEK